MRLVKETDAERMLQRVLAHIRAQGFHVLINAEPDDETRARYPRIVRDQPRRARPTRTGPT